MQIWFWIWIAVIVLSVVVEAITMDLITCWFAIGAIVPLVLSACRVGWEIQMIVFVLLSAILIISLRKVALKYLFKNNNAKTNMDLIIGKKVRMITRTDFETVGSVKINDIVWSAIGENQETIEVGEVAEVVAVAGNKLKIKPIKEPESKKTKENDIKNNEKQEKGDK